MSYSAVTRISSRLMPIRKSPPLCNQRLSPATMDSMQNTFMTSRFLGRQRRWWLMTVSMISSPSHAEDWVLSLPPSFQTTRVSLATPSWESAISMEESWLSIQPLGPNTLVTATSCRAVCTAAQEELEEARNSPDCAPCCSTIAVSSSRHQPIALRNWRDCASKPLPYIYNPSPTGANPKVSSLATWFVTFRYGGTTVVNLALPV